MTIRTIGLAGGALLLAGGLVTAAAAQRGGFAFGGYPYQSGQELYEHICQGCHMPGGKGAQGAGMYPALAGDKKLASPLYPVVVVLKGQKAMPAFGELSDAQVAAVANYVRTSFGNSFAGTVTPEQVKALRPPANGRGGFNAG